ncbi:hypothetical protein E8E12_002393 [Didymella heteroderae]|uniref:Uncharacterized protein n=1 Tax=Didymella heteroderae TaxID=1769908 RepID=A0A9P4WKB8_9PLEO|nr:hypothetical protein E8E12_002393 [Didymella heteroderae]
MSRSSSPISRPLSSPQLLLSPPILQSSPQSPDVTLRRHGSIISSTFVPSSASLDGNFSYDRDGAFSTPTTPAFRAEMDRRDEEALLNPGHSHRRQSAKHYEQMDSWVRLAKVGTIKFLMTVFFGGSLCLCLRSWEGFHGSIPLSKYEVRIFNALTIALSICLGLNLLTSLKRYAVFLRWAILTKYWVPVEVFDLILGIDELTNVTKLLVLATPALDNKWLLGRSQPWRNSHPGYRQRFAIVCLIWLLINIGSQVLVASLSLFWPTEPYICPLTKYGSVAVADLSKWDVEEEGDHIYSSREAAWRFGLEAQSWSNFSADAPSPELSQLPGTPIYKGDGYFEYRFFYRNPDRPWSDYLQSNRNIKARTRCKEYDILHDGGAGGLTLGVSKKETRFVSIPKSGSGMILWQAMIGRNGNSTCGARCTQILVYQARGKDGSAKNVNKSSFWDCDSQVDQVTTFSAGASHPGIKPSDTFIYGTDRFAMLAAGAIAWTGYAESNWTDRQYRLNTQDSPWSPARVLNTTEVEEMIMRFSIGAIAAFDDHGLRYNIFINNRTCDQTSQKLEVKWKYIWIILGSIGAIQFSALCYLLIRANKSIVRDSSYFSVAMLLRPVLEFIDDVPGRMAMTGTEIKNHPRLRDKNIRYDYNEKDDGTKQVTICVEGEFRGHVKKRWPSGDYGG